MIFVSIAAYRDAELIRTLEDGLAQCDRPHELHVAVLDQGPAPTPIAQSLKSSAGHFSYLHLHHHFSRGPSWARSVINSMLRDEDYVLQLDSHMRFDRHWDSHLIEVLEQCAQQNPKAIVSTYPCGYSTIDGNVQKRKMPGQALVLRPKPDAVFDDAHPILPFYAVPTATPKPVMGFHVGAGCLFSRARLLVEVPTDPWIYFHGEEQNLAVRAWTHGWDIWHAPEMPIYHHYNTHFEHAVHWSEEDDTSRPLRWWELHRLAQERMRRLLYAQDDLGAYGLGSTRSLQDYARASGIDYVQRKICAPAAL